MKILIVEDSQDLAINIGDFLLASHHVVDFAEDGMTGIHLALNCDYDVIVLDINLPRLNGLELCRKFRANTEQNIPILMLSARDTLENKLEGYSAGCDDYLVKPFSLAELEAKLVALHRLHYCSRDEDILRVADLEYRCGTRALSRGGRKLLLKPTTLRVLVELMRSSHRVVGRAELERKIWDECPPNTDALRAHIYAIRSSIDRDMENKLLHTIHGIGYRLASQDEL
ncbi:MAG: response regulator transcription factor [Gammaproteobacteria bacterium]|nr:response regulator transcription factor [Gammaproteobacteria bacterium]